MGMVKVLIVCKTLTQCQSVVLVPTYFGYPPRPYNVIGYLDATTAPIRHRGVVAFAARRAKELGADAIIVLSHGTEYAGTISTGSAFTSGQFYGSGFNATTTGTSFSGPLVFGNHFHFSYWPNKKV